MTAQPITKRISRLLNLPGSQVGGVVSLLAEGNTIPFIARYRKEATGSLDEVQISAIRDQLHLLNEIDKRRQSILASLEKNGHLTKDIQRAVQEAESLTSLEDIYLPYKPKRRTRGMKAQEAGLEPLALALYTRPAGSSASLSSMLSEFSAKLGHDYALEGARDIIAENIAEHRQTRQDLRQLFLDKAVIRSFVVEKNRETGAKYKDYFNWQEPVTRVAGHRFHAMLRGESEKILRVSLRPAEEEALAILYRRHITRKTGDASEVRKATEDCYKRLLAPSLENELRAETKAKADNEAIEVFAGNFKELLLAAPLGQKRVLALDPGFRTGAKLVCLDEQGNLLDSTTIYPTQSANQQKKSAETIRNLVTKHSIEAIGIGSGTAGRETEDFVRSLDLPQGVIITLVNEDGASVYSASETARKEFPHLDLTLRGAISIGRRLQDPLAELVKIDPKAIGVGQYQHDVNQAALKQGLDDVVEYCVNSVGVELNSSSEELLTYVSGVGPVLAANIIKFRNQNGPFKTRRDLLQVERLGPKAYEQCAGFLRVAASKNALDRSGIHPERYYIVKRMADSLAITVEHLLRSPDQQKAIRLENFVDDEVGLPTLQHIITELARPGRDPRPEFSRFSFAEGIHTIDDLVPGMRVPAIITNVTKFGAFADLGVHQDGLIHISQLADRFVKDPSEVVKTRQQVVVKILEVDRERKRISLSLKE